MHGTNMARKILYIIAVLSILALPLFTLASDVQQQQSTLYPFRNTIELQEEFISAGLASTVIGTHGWFTSGGTNTAVNGEANAPGIIRRDTSAVSGTVASLLFSGNQNQIVSTHVGNYIWRARLNTNDANTTLRIGLGNGYTTSPVGAGFYFEKADADTNWFAVCRAAGSETRVDTGVAVSTNFAIFTLQKLTASVSFSINGSTPVSVSTNCPVTPVQPASQIVNSAAAAKTVDYDYFQMQIFGVGR